MNALDPRTVRQALYVAVAVAFSGLIFFVFGERVGDASAIVSVVPVALVAAFFGTRAGLIATTLAFPFNTFVFDYLSGVRNEDGPVTEARALITLSLVVVSWVFGRYHVLSERVEHYERTEDETERARQRSEERLRDFLTAAPSPVFRFSGSGRLLELHGENPLEGVMDKADYLYRHLSDFLPAEFAASLIQGTERTLETGEIHVVVGEVDFGQGNRTYEVSLSPAGEEVIGIATDITTQIEIREQAKHAEGVRTREALVAAVAHELRTPLAAIIGFTEELCDKHHQFSETERQELLDTVSAEARRLGNRIDDLIVASRVDGGRVDLAPGRFDLVAATHEVVNALQASNVRVIGEGTAVVADEARTMHIIRNLIGNAITHGGDAVFVTIESGVDSARLVVNDDGSGTGLERRDDLFERYETVSQAETQPDRQGLGLVVARQLARLMDGDVEFQRKNGLSSLILTLPKAT